MSHDAQAEELAKALAQMKQVLQGTHGMSCRPALIQLECDVTSY